MERGDVSAFLFLSSNRPSIDFSSLRGGSDGVGHGVLRATLSKACELVFSDTRTEASVDDKYFYSGETLRFVRAEDPDPQVNYNKRRDAYTAGVLLSLCALYQAFPHWMSVPSWIYQVFRNSTIYDTMSLFKGGSHSAFYEDLRALSRPLSGSDDERNAYGMAIPPGLFALSQINQDVSSLTESISLSSDILLYLFISVPCQV